MASRNVVRQAPFPNGFNGLLAGCLLWMMIAGAAFRLVPGLLAVRSVFCLVCGTLRWCVTVRGGAPAPLLNTRCDRCAVA